MNLSPFCSRGIIIYICKYSKKNVLKDKVKDKEEQTKKWIIVLTNNIGNIQKEEYILKQVNNDEEDDE